MRISLLAVVALLMALTARGEVTLEQCLEAAHDNYPVIKRYDLLSATESVALSDINKGWLPKVDVYAQGSAQNVVPSFPSALTGMLEQMGGDVKGLGKLQYKVGVDVNQTIWDGGASRVQRQTERTRAEVSRRALDVEMYGIRERVQSLYFGILLLQKQIDRSQSAADVYAANLERLSSMLKNGVAMQSDYDMVEAQQLTIYQQLDEAKASLDGLRNVLSLLTGLNLADQTLSMPDASMPSNDLTQRPELSLLDARKALNDTRLRGVDVSLMPKIGFFAQSYYGYPGIDYFKAMMSRNPSFKIVAGARVSWAIDGLYKKKNTQRQVALDNKTIDNERETFLFNTSLQAAAQRSDIAAIRTVMQRDARIVELRGNVRRAAESQLRNGVIDATALVTKINDETQASLNEAYHQIQLVQAIYNLKNTLNQ